ncbi:EpsG family protein [Acinetobacter indicus]|nr:EpsG family protein [Acinetobacter indicus]
MLPYFLIYFFLTINTLIANAAKNNAVKKIFLFLSVIIISSLYYFRDPVIGTDTKFYVMFFDIIKDLNFSEYHDFSQNYGLEYFFVLFSGGLLLLGDNNIVLFLYAFFIYYFVFKSFYLSKLNFVFLALGLFSFFSLYFWGFNILRQCLALSLVICGSIFLIKGNKIKFAIYISLGSLFHLTAIFCFFFYFIYRYRIFLFKNIIYLNLIFLIFLISSFKVFDLIGSGYSFYINEAENVSPFGWLTMFLYFFICCFSMVVANKNQYFFDSGSFFSIILSLFVSYNVFLNILGFSNQGLNRMGFYFLWPVIFIIPMIFDSITNGKNKILYGMILYIIYTLYFIYTVNLLSDDMIPFVWKN